MNVEYLQGSCGEYQNIVLGVSDLEDESLKKIKAYGFTKYHQKLFQDTDYILDLFSLNDDIDRNVHVTVYYFDKTAKFSLLNNLLAILGKDKVEQWMKNKWLCFKPNPEIKFLAQESPDVDQAS